jgi:hypothetical protein
MSDFPSTAIFKLVSPLGTLLGLVYMPAFVAEEMKKYPALISPVPISDLDFVLKMRTEEIVKKFSPGKLEYSHLFGGSVMLSNMSVEELEKIPGFSFCPGAGYMRSLMQEEN